MYATEAQAGAFYGDGLTPETLSLVMRVAGRTVAMLGEDDGTDEYAEAAADAELFIGKWVKTNGYGTLSSKSLSGVSSKSYASIDEVKKLAASALGPYYSGGTGASGSVGVITSFPFGRG